MGPGVTGLVKDLVGKPRTLDDGRPGGFYVPRFRNLTDKQSGLHPRLRLRRRAAARGCSPATPSTRPASARRTRRQVRDYAGAFINMGGFGEVLAALRELRRASIPSVKDAWGIPVLRFHYKFGDNERKMAADMADTAREMFEAAGIEIVSVERRTCSPRAGRSTSWAPRAWATIRRRPCVNQFQQSHDVKNLFVVDGSTHVSASCQNPTWTIMALCWRSCDYLADQLRKGEL